MARGVRPARSQGAAGTILKLVVLLGSPLLLFCLLLLVPKFDALFLSANFHMVVMSTIAACAFFTAVTAWVTAARVRHEAVIFVAFGCLGLAIFMLGHGLTTPGTLGQPLNAWVGRFPVLGISTFALFLALAAFGAGRRIGSLVVRAPSWLLAAPIVGLVLVAAAVVTNPHLGHGEVPLPAEDTITWIVGIAAGIALVPTGAVFFRQWRFGRDPVQLALAVACWYSTCALVSMRFGRLWRLSWWDYHVYLLAGFGAATWAIARETRLSRGRAAPMTRLSVKDPIEQIAHGYTESLRPLVAAVEAKDHYTHGHSERVSTLAARLALAMGLSPEDVRSVAEGAYLHDIGKIGVPDSVLNKPGTLTAEERMQVEQHPVVGYEIVGRAVSLRHALPVIHRHHERWDGAGYPDGIEHRDIPLTACLVAVVDVWDALTTDRAYRPAWTPEAALDLILRARGSHFEPDCVDAFAVIARDLGLRDAPSATGLALTHPGDVCHHRVDLARRQARLARG